MIWNKLLCSRQELQLVGTLNGGQSFRWTHDKDNDEWIGLFSNTVWKLRQTDNHLEYQIIGSKHKKNDAFFKKLLEDYFHLDINIAEHYKIWSEKDELFRTACEQFYGVRMLRQELVENIFSFICSQHNSITRITSMVQKLCSNYGEEICTLDGQKYYAFPDVEKLAPPEVQTKLSQLAFGFRSKYIQKSAAQIVNLGSEKWLEKLKKLNYNEARRELMLLPGIGPKVADCICLMSLDHLESVPVDLHVYQIASQNYLPHLKGRKNINITIHAEIADHFRKLFGDKAGWAQTVLFCADLKKFQKADEEENGSKVIKKKRKK